MKVLNNIYPFITVIGWGAAFPAISYAVANIPAIDLVVIRFLMAAIVFVLLYCFRVIKYLGIEKCDYVRFIVLTILGVPLYHIALAYGETGVSATSASVIGQFTPIFALFFTIRQRAVRFSHIAGLVIAMMGSLLVINNETISSDSYEVSFVHVVITLIAPLSLALYTVLAKPLVSKYGAENLTSQVIVMGSIFCTILGVFNGTLLNTIIGMELDVWVVVAILAFLSTVLAYTYWYKALELMDAAKLSSYIYFVPAVSILLSSLVLGEKIGVFVLFGGLFVTCGIWMVNRS